MNGIKKVFFYLVDGARPDVIEKLINSDKLPNIKKYLYDEGTYHRGTTCLPSTTGPAYLPFLTGVHPADHHITGIRWFDKPAYFKKNRWHRNAMRSYCGYEAKFFNDDMDPNFPSLFEEYSENGYNLYNMITKGVKVENDVTKDGKTGLYFRAHFKHEHHPVDEAGHERLMNVVDQDPQFVFAVFPSVDWDSHTYHYEDERTIAAYQIADRSLADLVLKLKDRNEYEDALIIMVSDHGLSATQQHLDLGKFFKQHKYRVLEYPAIWSILPQVAIFISGNSFATLSFLDKKEMYQQEALIKNHGPVLNALVQQAGVDFIGYRGNNGQVILHNEHGTAEVGKDDQGNYFYRRINADPLLLDQDVDHVDETAAYQLLIDKTYPDAFHQLLKLMSSHRSGDVIICAKIGWDLRDFWEIPEHRGSHGSLHKEHILVPMLFNKKINMNSTSRTTAIHQIIKNWLS